MVAVSPVLTRTMSFSFTSTLTSISFRSASVIISVPAIWEVHDPFAFSTFSLLMVPSTRGEDGGLAVVLRLFSRKLRTAYAVIGGGNTLLRCGDFGLCHFVSGFHTFPFLREISFSSNSFCCDRRSASLCRIGQWACTRRDLAFSKLAFDPFQSPLRSDRHTTDRCPVGCGQAVVLSSHGRPLSLAVRRSLRKRPG